MVIMLSYLLFFSVMLFLTMLLRQYFTVLHQNYTVL